MYNIKYGKKLNVELNIVRDQAVSGCKMFRNFSREIVLGEQNLSLRNRAPGAGPDPVTSSIRSGRNDRYTASCFHLCKRSSYLYRQQCLHELNRRHSTKHNSCTQYLRRSVSCNVGTKTQQYHSFPHRGMYQH